MNGSTSAGENLSLFPQPSIELLIPDGLRKEPKIDLHRHLLGSISASTVVDVAKECNLALPSSTVEGIEQLLSFREPVRGLQEFFRPWSILSRLIVSPQTISRFVYLALKDAYDDNVIYAELRVGWGMTGREPFGVREFLEAVEVGLHRAESEFGVIGRAVFGITRHLFARHADWKRKQLWKQIIEAVADYKDSVVVGFDLSGIEEGYPARLFAEELQEARKCGFPLTVHCGETAGPEDISEVLETLAPARISHAVSAVKDDRVLQQLVASQTAVEACPTSNWLTGAVPELEGHPIIGMDRAGVRLTINTDNPVICRTTLSREYVVVQSVIGLSPEAVNRFKRNALEAMFGDRVLNERVKARWLRSDTAASREAGV